MDSQAGKVPLLAWVAAISLIVCSGIGVAALMGWLPISLDIPDAPVLRKLGPSVAHAPEMCASVPTQPGRCVRLASGARLPLPLTGARSTGPGTALPFRVFFFLRKDDRHEPGPF